jgi:hypothetical protein
LWIIWVAMVNMICCIDFIYIFMITYKEQIALSINLCSICKERRIGMKISNEVCKRCSIYKNIIKLYSEDNNMDPNHRLQFLQTQFCFDNNHVHAEYKFWNMKLIEFIQAPWDQDFQLVNNMSSLYFFIIIFCHIHASKVVFFCTIRFENYEIFRYHRKLWPQKLVCIWQSSEHSCDRKINKNVMICCIDFVYIFMITYVVRINMIMHNTTFVKWFDHFGIGPTFVKIMLR